MVGTRKIAGRGLKLTQSLRKSIWGCEEGTIVEFVSWVSCDIQGFRSLYWHTTSPILVKGHL